MKKEFLIPAVLILFALIVAAIVLVGPGPSAPVPANAVVALEDSVEEEHQSRIVGSAEDEVSGPKVADVPPLKPTTPVLASVAAVPTNSTEVVLARIDDAIVTYAPEGVGLIAPYLSSKDPEIRAAAIEGLKQLGEPEGARVLRQLARKVRDPRDQKELIDAAEFIELPSVEFELVEP